MQKDEALIQKLTTLAAKHHVSVIDQGGGHFQIQGALLVNYYPFSKRKTAYVDATVGGVHFVTPAQAIQMAKRPPPVLHVHQRDKRNRNGRKDRIWLIKKHGAQCHWCHQPLTLEDSTVDHEIPIARGGLDNRNNKVLACHDCNQARGHAMPELKEETPHAR